MLQPEYEVEVKYRDVMTYLIPTNPLLADKLCIRTPDSCPMTPGWFRTTKLWI